MLVSSDYPARTIQEAPAAAPRPVPAECPRGSRGGAATRPRNSLAPSRRVRGPSRPADEPSFFPSRACLQLAAAAVLPLVNAPRRRRDGVCAVRVAALPLAALQSSTSQKCCPRVVKLQCVVRGGGKRTRGLAGCVPDVSHRCLSCLVLSHRYRSHRCPRLGAAPRRRAAAALVPAPPRSPRSEPGVRGAALDGRLVARRRNMRPAAAVSSPRSGRRAVRPRRQQRCWLGRAASDSWPGPEG